MNLEHIALIKHLVITVLIGYKFTYAEVIRALGELIAELAVRSVEEDKE